MIQNEHTILERSEAPQAHRTIRRRHAAIAHAICTYLHYLTDSSTDAPFFIFFLANPNVTKVFLRQSYQTSCVTRRNKFM